MDWENDVNIASGASVISIRRRSQRLESFLKHSKVKILLVDDQQRNLDALSVVLENPDYELIQVNSGPQALYFINNYEFAVVLLDVMMPDMDGFEVAQKIRSSPSSVCNSTPIIFVSAVADEMSFVFKGYNAGAVDYIVKPLEPAVVKAKVAIFVELFRAKHLLKFQLEETRRLCQKLEIENAEKQRQLDDVISELHSLLRVFEEDSAFLQASHSVKKEFKPLSCC